MEKIIMIIYAYLIIVTLVEAIISILYISKDPIWYPCDINHKISNFWSWFIFVIVRIISPVITLALHGGAFIAWYTYKLFCYMSKKYYTRRKSK